MNKTDETLDHEQLAHKECSVKKLHAPTHLCGIIILFYFILFFAFNYLIELVHFKENRKKYINLCLKLILSKIKVMVWVGGVTCVFSRWGELKMERLVETPIERKRSQVSRD
jgi:uncharacterized membrane protein YesL